ncbi:hypothetical protein ACFL0L_03080 [Patescibacteria group bacterium]
MNKPQLETEEKTKVSNKVSIGIGIVFLGALAVAASLFFLSDLRSNTLVNSAIVIQPVKIKNEIVSVPTGSPIVGTSNTLYANGIPKDRHTVMFDSYIFSVYLDMYRTSGDGGSDPEAGKGYLRFRKSGDGSTWTEALTNPQDVISGKHFFIGTDMVGDKTCMDPQDCNIYLIYFRNDSTWGCGNTKNLYGGGEVYFRELTFDQDAEQWTLQAEMQITNNPVDVWWDTYASWKNGVGDGRLCNSYISGPVFDAEPKPQIWVEDDRALILYDIQTEHGQRSAAFPACAAPPYDPTTCNDGRDYTYLRIKNMTRSASGDWTIDASSERDAAYFPNCVSGDPVGGSDASGFIYSAITKNPVNDGYAIIYNRAPRGSCSSESTWAPIPQIDGDAPLGYIWESVGSSFEWLCGHDSDDEFTNGTTCSQDVLENLNPGPNFSVASHDSIINLRRAIRVVYPFDTASGQDIRLNEFKYTDETTVGWVQTDVGQLAGFGSQDAVVPVIANDGEHFWIAAHTRENSSGNDYIVQYRKIQVNSSDPDPANWTLNPSYPVNEAGVLNENRTTDTDVNVTIPLKLNEGKLTRNGHPPLIWLSGSENPYNILFPGAMSFIPE